MSSKTLKRWATASMQALIVVVVVTAAGMALSKPECREKLLVETFCGIAAGLHCGLLHALHRIAEANHAAEPTNDLYDEIRADLIHELKAGFLGGWLFGLTVGVWQFFRC